MMLGSHQRGEGTSGTPTYGTPPPLEEIQRARPEWKLDEERARNLAPHLRVPSVQISMRALHHEPAQEDFQDEGKEFYNEFHNQGYGYENRYRGLF